MLEEPNPHIARKVAQAARNAARLLTAGRRLTARQKRRGRYWGSIQKRFAARQMGAEWKRATQAARWQARQGSESVAAAQAAQRKGD